MTEQFPFARSVTYRPDIDGLRAVAVLSVLLGHLNMTYLTGGFVGVDIFFVISGYLISAIILTEIEQSRFSVLRFYERRIRRIFPALFCVLLVVSIVAFVYLLPSELISYCKALLATVGFVSNFYFLSNSNYFDLPTTSPLLHTWSLAVEEQFYLVFPPFLLMIRWLFRRRFKIVITVVAVVSFIVSVIVVKYDQNNAFYMLYSRAWELLIGTMLSQRMFPRLGSRWSRNVVTFVGACLLAYPILFYTLQTPFPGLGALMPCVGTALIIGAGDSGPSLVNSALSWRPVVFVGLISYSLYLWHWPVLVFQQMGIITPDVHELPQQLAVLLTRHRLNLIFDFAIPFVLATLSWRFVERPFRTGKLRLSGRPLFAFASVLICVFISVALVAETEQGFPNRFSRASLQVAAQSDMTEFGETTRGGKCFIGMDTHFEQFDFKDCLREDSSKSNYLLLGDSKAAMLYYGLSQIMPKVNLMQANVTGCGTFIDPVGDRDCVKLSRYIYHEYLPTHKVDAVILCKHWAANDLGRLNETVEWSKRSHIQLIIIGPNPTYDMPLPRLEAYAIAWNKPKMVSQHLDGEVARLDEQMADLAKTVWHVQYVSLYRVICQNGPCREFVDPARTVPMLLDTGHLTPLASEFVANHLKTEGIFQ